MNASDPPCDSTEENQSVGVPVQMEKNDFAAESDPMAKSSDVVAKGLSAMLSTIIRDFDCRAEETFKSQDQLSFALDRLTRELDQLLEDAPLPFIMQHATKISSRRQPMKVLDELTHVTAGQGITEGKKLHSCRRDAWYHSRTVNLHSSTHCIEVM